MSRSIGDWDAGEVGVVPDPLIDVLDIAEIKRRVAESMNEKCKMAEAEVDPASGESQSSEEQCSATYTEGDVKVFALSATDVSPVVDSADDSSGCIAAFRPN